MSLFDILFPRYCLECKQPGKYICDSCISKVAHGGWRGIDYSVFKYEGVIRRAIIALKYKFATDLVDELVAACIGRSVNQYSLFSNQKSICLVPIPLHWHRHNWRGFNQAELIGEKLAKQMKWDFVPDLLLRTKESTPQVQLKGVGRRKNLNGVFSVNPIRKSLILNHESLVLFDDVYTTGSTIKEAERVLKLAGFRNIISLTIAG
jgi:competence protein ComFC